METDMTIQFGLTDALVNSEYAPLVALCADYQQRGLFKALESVSKHNKEVDYRLADKLVQVLLSMLGGCETLSEVNTKLTAERGLPAAWGWERIADQSTLSRTLDELSLKQIDELQLANQQIWRSFSRTCRHNWHGYLCLEYDLSGLPCSAQAEASQKGFFSEKKTPPGGS
jgi:hypothetical protein